ncbi:hypothetical protein [Planomonospora alba]|uniref:hypothetical protein n=1 Tax=Planomonospora alba TaxID=161354 RepID=UPI0031E63BDF
MTRAPRERKSRRAGGRVAGFLDRDAVARPDQDAGAAVARMLGPLPLTALVLGWGGAATPYRPP